MATTVTASESDASEDVKDPGAEKSAEASKEADETLDASDASDDDSNDDGTDADSDESKEDRPKKKESGYEKRIRKLTKQRGDAQREMDYWKAEALKQKQSQESKSDEAQKPKASLEGKPKAEDFESHSEFVEALADWKYEQRKASDEKKQKETQLKTEFEKSVESFKSKTKEFSKTHKDFQELVSDVDDIPMSIGVQEALLGSDVGPELMYELVKDRENYERINALSPLSAARELGRIEARIHTREESSSEPKKNSSAPAPLKPVGKHGSGGVKKSLTDPDIPFADYERIRREQMAAKKRRA